MSERTIHVNIRQTSVAQYFMTGRTEFKLARIAEPLLISAVNAGETKPGGIDSPSAAALSVVTMPTFCLISFIASREISIAPMSLPM